MGRRIAIVTFYTDTWAPLGKVVDANKREYAKKHGYAFHTSALGFLEASWMRRPPAWHKIKLLQRHLPQYDWVMWSDADAVVVDMDQGLEQFLDDRYDIILAKDGLGINTGNMFLRNTPWTANFLQRVWDEAKDPNHPWWENQAIIELLDDPETASHVRVDLYPKYNHYVDNPNAFILHFAGVRDMHKVLEGVMKALGSHGLYH